VIEPDEVTGHIRIQMGNFYHTFLENWNSGVHEKSGWTCPLNRDGHET